MNYLQYSTRYLPLHHYSRLSRKFDSLAWLTSTIIEVRYYLIFHLDSNHISTFFSTSHAIINTRRCRRDQYGAIAHDLLNDTLQCNEAFRDLKITDDHSLQGKEMSTVAEKESSTDTVHDNEPLLPQISGGLQLKMQIGVSFEISVANHISYIYHIYKV